MPKTTAGGRALPKRGAVTRNLRKRPTRPTPMARRESTMKRKVKAQNPIIRGGSAPRPSAGSRPAGNPFTFPGNPGSLVIASAERIKQVTQGKGGRRGTTPPKRR